jgi:hypothetical protein
MVVAANLSVLRRASWGELLIRFALGGFATVGAGIVANVWGPAVGGLFLAFPAIFCASASLIEKHERTRKEHKGLPGNKRGKDAAALDAAGAGIGAVALAAFGACVWLLAEKAGAASLVVAAAAWIAAAPLMWLMRRRLRLVRPRAYR